MQLLPPVLGAWSLGLGPAGVLVTVLLWQLASRRAQWTREALHTVQGTLPDGALLLVLAGAVAAGGALALLGVVLLLPR